VDDTEEHGHPADRRGRVEPPVRAPADRVAAALCTTAEADGRWWDATTRRLVASLVREYHETVGDDGGVEFDPESGEFRSETGDIRLEVDRFPVDDSRWEAAVAGAAVVGLAAVGAARTGVAPAAWLAVGALAFVATGTAVRRGARADVSVVDAEG
jgi:hypothetical protein